MTIKLSLVVKNKKKYFSMVITIHLILSIFLLLLHLSISEERKEKKRFVEKPSLMTIELSLVVKKICLASICTNCFSYDVQKYIIKHANSTNKGLRKNISYYTFFFSLCFIFKNIYVVHLLTKYMFWNNKIKKTRQIITLMSPSYSEPRIMGLSNIDHVQINYFNYKAYYQKVKSTIACFWWNF